MMKSKLSISFINKDLKNKSFIRNKPIYRELIKQKLLIGSGKSLAYIRAKIKKANTICKKFTSVVLLSFLKLLFAFLLALLYFLFLPVFVGTLLLIFKLDNRFKFLLVVKTPNVKIQDYENSNGNLANEYSKTGGKQNA